VHTTLEDLTRIHIYALIEFIAQYLCVDYHSVLVVLEYVEVQGRRSEVAEKAHLSFCLSSQSGYPQYISVIKCMDMSVRKVKGINGVFRTEAIFLSYDQKLDMLLLL